MASLKQLIVKIGADTKGLDDGLAKAKTGLSGLDEAAAGIGSRFASVGGGARELGATLSLGLTAPIVAAGAGIIAVAGQFEASMNKLQGISGVTGDAFEGLREKAKSLGATTQFSASEAAQGMIALSQAGLSAGQVMAGIGGTLTLAAAGGLELGRASEIAANAMAQFGLDASEVDRVAQTLAATASASTTDIEQLSMGLKFGGLSAASAGLSFEQAAAALGILANKGMAGSTSGERLRSVLGALAKPSETAAKELKALGISLSDVDVEARGLPAVLDTLKNANLTTSQAINLFGVEAKDAARALIDAGGSGFDQFTAKLTGTTAATDQAAANMKGFQGAMKELSSAVEGLAIAIADSGLIDWATALVTKFTDVVRSVSEVSPGLLQLGVVLAGLVAAIGPVIGAAGLLAGGWAALAPIVAGAGTAISGFGATALAVATGPIGLTVAAIAAIGGGLYLLFDHLGVLDPILTAIGGAFSAVGSTISAVWDNLGALTVGFAVWVGEMTGATPVLGVLIEALTMIGGYIGGKLLSAFQIIGEAIRLVVLVHVEALTAAFGWLKDKAVAVFEFFVSKGKTALGETGDAAKEATKETKEMATSVAALGSAGTSATPAVAKVATAVKETAKEAKDAKAKVFDLEKSIADAERAANKIANTLRDKTQVAAKALAEEMKASGGVIVAGLDRVSAAVDLAIVDLSNWKGNAIETWDAVAAKAAAKTSEIEAAYHSFGLKTAAELQTLASAAEASFNTIKNSGTATTAQLNTAWAAMMEAKKKAMIAAGSDLPAEEQKMLDKVLAAQKGHVTDSEAVFRGFGATVTGIVSNMKLGEKLFSGDFSLASAKGLLDDIGKAFTDKLKQPAIDAINGLIEKGIGVLMGALDGLIAKLIGQNGLNAALNAAFGAASSAGGSAAGSAAGSSAGGGGGGLGGFSGAGGDPIQWALEATGIILDLARGRRHGEKLTLIEENTRQIVGAIRDDIMPDLWFKSDMIQWGPTVKATEATASGLESLKSAMILKLEDVYGVISSGAGVIAQQDTASEIRSLRSDLMALLGRDIVLEVDGLEIARATGAAQEQLRATA